MYIHDAFACFFFFDYFYIFLYHDVKYFTITVIVILLFYIRAMETYNYR